jgi:hypothetical protein
MVVVPAGGGRAGVGGAADVVGDGADAVGVERPVDGPSSHREQNETPSVSATIDALYTDRHLRVRERIAMSHSISQTLRLTRPGEP